jgi:serine/threonine protein kinase
LTPERWAEIEVLFHRAAECEPEHRTVLLDEVCPDDPELRREVEALLSCQESAGDHLKAAVNVGLDAVGFPLTGETISHYRILDGLSKGGMGLVYRAEDIKLGRKVALKFLPDHSAKDAGALVRFEREARSASALEHPNICPIYEFGAHEGRPFLVMQLLEGQTLRELIAAASPGKPPLGIEKLLDLAAQIVTGLDVAHQKAIIHRDIKPANIFVTDRGQAKILDFGLAKLVPVLTLIGERSDRNPDDEGVPRTPRENEELATPDSFLSQTGVAMGTAGYMSPEQARSEKLDARTDLFSFGLVLYEMATGQRAFKGDAGPLLHDAVLRQLPVPVRQLNPSLPAKLEGIIHRALEKDRDARYQTASEVLSDLQTIKQEMEPKRLARGWKVAAGTVVLLLAGATFWFAQRQPSPTQTLPDLKLRQLTINSSENLVTGGAISPDGKYLAYTDAKGIHVKLVGTDEARSVPQPEALKSDNVDWEIVSTAWFPDSTKFVANAHLASGSPSVRSTQTSSIWMVFVQDGVPRKLRDNAIAWSVSPDGSVISFGSNKGKFGEREIWLMGPSGEHPRKLLETDEINCLAALSWTPDGQRLIYVRSGAPCDGSNDTLVSSDLKGGPIATLLSPSEMKKISDFSWLPDGRLIYSDRCNSALMRPDTPCNFWTMRLDALTGKLIDKPKRLTNLVGSWMNNSSATVDSKRVAFLESSVRGTGDVADLEAGGTRLVNSRRFTLEEGDDGAIFDWTADSKTVILGYNRGDHYGLYKQFLNADTPEPIVTAAAGGLLENAQVSPDGKWVIIQVWPITGGATIRLMRVPITGGSPELIFPVREGSLSFCARPPSSLCAVAEQTVDRKQMIITAFDPIKGRGPELARFDLDPNYDTNVNNLLWSISPDGTSLAAARGPEGPIQICSLRGRPTQVISANGLNNMRIFHWAADGKGLYVANGAKGGTVLLHVDLQGNAHVLWENHGGHWAYGVPSPDNRQLAIYDRKLSANMWMMENF